MPAEQNHRAGGAAARRNKVAVAAGGTTISTSQSLDAAQFSHRPAIEMTMVLNLERADRADKSVGGFGFTPRLFRNIAATSVA